MPKINVYLPDDLAGAVKEMGVPVSAICQRALEASVRRVTAIRQATLGEVPLDDPGGRMSHLTRNARSAVVAGVRAAYAAGADEAGTGHLLAGVLANEANLAFAVLTSMEIEPAAVRDALARRGITAAAAAAVSAEAAGDQARTSGQPGEPRSLRFSGPAANALELAVTEAIGLGHNYVGCEHLLLGIATETEGTGGEVLRDLGAEPRPVRRAISAALAGYTAITATKQAQAAAAQPQQSQVLTMLREAVRREMQPFTERLERLEERLGPEDEQGSPA